MLTEEHNMYIVDNHIRLQMEVNNVLLEKLEYNNITIPSN